MLLVMMDLVKSQLLPYGMQINHIQVMPHTWMDLSERKVLVLTAEKLHLISKDQIPVMTNSCTQLL